MKPLPKLPPLLLEVRAEQLEALVWPAPEGQAVLMVEQWSRQDPGGHLH